jgi:hypothetical protein
MDYVLQSGFEVLHPSASQLVVAAYPPTWLVLVIVGVDLLVYFGTKAKGKNNLGVALLLLAINLPLLSFTLKQGRAVFDKSAGTAAFDRVDFLFRTTRTVFPLDQVQYATVETLGNSWRFVVVLKGHPRESILGFTSFDGQHAAAGAVNSFLGLGGGQDTR